MSKEGSVAPQERVNITYKPASGDAQTEVELPLKMLFIGDYTGRHDPLPLEERKPVNIDKDNFQQVLSEHHLAVEFSVPNTLTPTQAGELDVKLQFRSLNDFGPQAVAEQVPEMRRLLELRQALTALKSPLGNEPAFRKKLQALLGDATGRDRLTRALGTGATEEK